MRKNIFIIIIVIVVTLTGCQKTVIPAVVSDDFMSRAVAEIDTDDNVRVKSARGNIGVKSAEILLDDQGNILSGTYTIWKQAKQTYSEDIWLEGILTAQSNDMTFSYVNTIPLLQKYNPLENGSMLRLEYFREKVTAINLNELLSDDKEGYTLIYNDEVYAPYIAAASSGVKYYENSSTGLNEIKKPAGLNSENYRPYSFRYVIIAHNSSSKEIATDNLAVIII